MSPPRPAPAIKTVVDDGIIGVLWSFDMMSTGGERLESGEWSGEEEELLKD
jgi:hypothetical protein